MNFKTFFIFRDEQRISSSKDIEDGECTPSSPEDTSINGSIFRGRARTRRPAGGGGGDRMGRKCSFEQILAEEDRRIIDGPLRRAYSESRRRHCDQSIRLMSSLLRTIDSEIKRMLSPCTSSPAGTTDYSPMSSDGGATPSPILSPDSREVSVGN